MTKKIIAVIAFLAGLVALDRAIGFGLLLAFEQTSTGEAGGQINEALSRKDSDIIVFGDSRAKHHIDPAVLTSITGHSAYNAGCNGQGVYYARMLEMLMLERGSRAKVFVLHVNAWNLYVPTPERAMQLAIFADEEPEIRDVLAEAGPFVKFKILSHAFRFNSVPLAILKNIGDEPDKRDGYAPLKGDMSRRKTRPATLVVPPQAEIVPTALEKFRGFIEDARSTGKKTVLVAGPWLRRGKPHELEREGLDELSSLARNLGASFLEIDERTEPAFRDAALYKDEAHLNERGSAIFSDLLGKAIEALL